MITWANLFNGYDVYGDVFSAYPSLYTQATSNNSAYDLYHQFVVNLPSDLALVFTIFFSSIVPLVLVAALLFVFFMPLLRRAQRW